MPLEQERRYTYADLLCWDDDVRYELYDGVPVALASPTDAHQKISMALSAQFYNFLAGKKCTPYAAPFDVRLFEELGDLPEDVDVVVQPDLLVVCDASKVDRHGVHGAPDLVIEILSDSSLRTDRIIKFNLYQQAGVKEYWIVDPFSRTVSVHILEDGKYPSPTVYTSNASVPVGVLEGCSIDLATVFPPEEEQSR
jgi:Uma2 family endonuclease